LDEPTGWLCRFATTSGILMIHFKPDLPMIGLSGVRRGEVEFDQRLSDHPRVCKTDLAPRCDMRPSVDHLGCALVYGVFSAQFTV
jgi:hypothetical protein